MDTCYSHLLRTRAESAGISPLRPAGSSPHECALQSCQRFNSPTQIPWLPQKQYKEPSVTSQRDLLLIFWKRFCTQESPARGMKRCPCAYKLHHRNRRKGPKGALRCLTKQFSAVTWAYQNRVLFRYQTYG